MTRPPRFELESLGPDCGLSGVRVRTPENGWRWPAALAPAPCDDAGGAQRAAEQQQGRGFRDGVRGTVEVVTRDSADTDLPYVVQFCAVRFHFERVINRRAVEGLGGLAVDGIVVCANGTLSLKGTSRPQALTFTLSGEGLRRRVEGRASIDRAAFGVGTGESAAGLGTSVSLNFAFDAVGREP